MTLASDIANMLTEKGYTGLKPWSSKKYFGIERIYYHLGYVELSGKFGLKFYNLDYVPKFIEDCKICLKVWKEKREKKLESIEELPF